MSRPTRTTIIYALVGGFLVVPVALLLNPFLIWPMAFKLVLWIDLSVYTVLLVRWRRK